MFLGLAGLSLPTLAPAQERLDPVDQGIQDELAHLRPQLDDLARRAALRDSLEAAQRTAAQRVSFDTFSVGPLRVIAQTDHIGLARDLLGPLWAEWEGVAEGLEETLGRSYFLIRKSTRKRGEVFPDGDSVLDLTVMGGPDSDLARTRARTRFSQALMRGAPEEVVDWVGYQILPSPHSAEWVVRTLMAFPSTAVRRCYRGETSWCLESMGLGGGEQGWDRWYTPRERRLLVRRLPWTSSEARLLALRDRCQDDQDLAACDLFLSNFLPKPPLGTSVRSSLVSYALRRGAPGSLARFLEGANSSIEERLEAAAGLPVDALVDEWREYMLAHAPSAWAGLGGDLTAVLCCFILFGLMASRSTRWRLG